ncbi:MAG: hypothetical protein H6637_05275 [Ardenticatenales bacterium]|nr:hypothetical protein [Ardenticatenales bacterium]
MDFSKLTDWRRGVKGEWLGNKWRPQFEPHRVRAWLRTPVVSDQFLPLDGILLYQAHRNLEGAQIMTLPGEYVRNAVSNLPLGMVHAGRRNWYYRASWAVWGDEGEGKSNWVKRFDQQYVGMIDFGKKKGRVDVGSGHYKAYRMTVYTRPSRWVEWYVMSDYDCLVWLLSTVTHLGKKASQGWGRVSKWEIEPMEADHSIWRDGELMRGIPAEDVMEYIADGNTPHGLQRGEYGIRPSYWKRGNQMQLVLPS